MCRSLRSLDYGSPGSHSPSCGPRCGHSSPGSGAGGGQRCRYRGRGQVRGLLGRGAFIHLPVREMLGARSPPRSPPRGCCPLFLCPHPRLCSLPCLLCSSFLSPLGFARIAGQSPRWGALFPAGPGCGPCHIPPVPSGVPRCGKGADSSPPQQSDRTRRRAGVETARQAGRVLFRALPKPGRVQRAHGSVFSWELPTKGGSQAAGPVTQEAGLVQVRGWKLSTCFTRTSVTWEAPRDGE